MSNDNVKVLRLIEYIGPRQAVEAAVRQSIHGSKTFNDGNSRLIITVITIGEYPLLLLESEEDIAEKVVEKFQKDADERLKRVEAEKAAIPFPSKIGPSTTVNSSPLVWNNTSIHPYGCSCGYCISTTYGHSIAIYGNHTVPEEKEEEKDDKF